ncbi:hypothetical protein EDB86DRAFT_2829439 [Lactarius hatsudake]|nr:hypothetical protein EDB86DRAFT_2829439 [Lactarius hatsudake]
MGNPVSLWGYPYLYPPKRVPVTTGTGYPHVRVWVLAGFTGAGGFDGYLCGRLVVVVIAVTSSRPPSQPPLLLPHGPLSGLQLEAICEAISGLDRNVRGKSGCDKKLVMGQLRPIVMVVVASSSPHHHRELGERQSDGLIDSDLRQIGKHLGESGSLENPRVIWVRVMHGLENGYPDPYLPMQGYQSSVSSSLQALAHLVAFAPFPRFTTVLCYRCTYNIEDTTLHSSLHLEKHLIKQKIEEHKISFRALEERMVDVENNIDDDASDSQDGDASDSQNGNKSDSQDQTLEDAATPKRSPGHDCCKQVSLCLSRWPLV